VGQAISVLFRFRLAFGACLLPSLALSWGFDGHRRLSSMMHEPLPSQHCLRGWMAARQSFELQNKSVEPDRLRDQKNPNFDPAEAPRHFLDIDELMPIADYPRDFAQAQRQLGQFATSNGTVPWRVESQYAQLVEAFKSKNEKTITETAFFMSHYVTDAFSILHSTKRFDDPTGIHSRSESEIVRANLEDLTQAARTFFGTAGAIDPKNAIFDIIIVGNGQVNALYSANAATPNDLPAFYARTREVTAKRWGDATTVMASLVWSAWSAAGAPALDGFAAGCNASVVSTPVRLAGLPVVGGWTWSVDAGPGMPMNDAGSMTAEEDAGPVTMTMSGDAGGPTPNRPTEMNIVNPKAPIGCGCSAEGLSISVALVALIRARMRRRERH
jgi:hypothetical protein